MVFILTVLSSSFGFWVHILPKALTALDLGFLCLPTELVQNWPKCGY